MGVTANGRSGIVQQIFGTRPGIFLICLLAWTLTNMDQALFGFAVPGMLAEFGLSLQAVGVILTVSFAAAAVLVIPAGFAADRFGRGATLCGLLLVSALMVGFQGLAGGVMMLTLFRALGFGISAGVSPVTNALVVENAGARYRGVAMGLLQCGYPLGWLLASFGAAPLLASHGWRATCFLAFLVVPLVLPLWWLLRRYQVDRPVAVGGTTPVQPDVAAGGIGVLLSPANRRVSLATGAIFFLFGGAYAGSAFFFPTFFIETRGYTPADAASLIGLSNGIAVFGYLAAALVGEFVLTRRTVFVLWCLGGAAALGGLLWLSHGRTQDIMWYGLTAALFFGSQAVVIVFVAELFPAAIRTRALAICASAPLSLGFALFPLVVPAAVTALGWQAGLSAVVIPLLAGAGLIALLLPNRASGLPVA
jgi:MFS family permease